MQGRQEGKEPPLIRGQQLLFCLGRRLRLPLLNVSEVFIPLLMVFDLRGGESWGSLEGGNDSGFVTHEDLFFFR